MHDGEIPESLKQFIIQHLHSLEEVEVLTLLQKDGERMWTVQSLCQAMTSSTASIEKRLSDLCAAELVECTAGEKGSRYRYHPKTAALRKQVDNLVRIYPDFRFRVAQLIYANVRGPGMT